MAELGSWPSIERYGLLSTSALLDLFQVPANQREALECCRRPEFVEIVNPNLGRAVIRDQKPMNERHLLGLARDGGPVLRNGLSPCDWYRILNSKVFFWVNQERLETLLSARAYRSNRHTILVVDTETLLDNHLDRVCLSPINSGNTQPFPQPRGLDTFLPLNQYPFEEWLYKRRTYGEPIVELAVGHSVPDIKDHVIRVEEYSAGRPPVMIWERPQSARNVGKSKPSLC